MRPAPRTTIVLAMTETTYGPPPPPAPPPRPPQGDPPRLVRDPDDAVVAGVCAAFGRFTDTDPVLWRVTVAVLTLFGGAGLVLYALGWLLVPGSGQAQSVVERTLRRPDRGVSPLGVLGVVVGAVVLLAILDDGPGFGALLVLAGIAYLVFRERRDPRPVAPVRSSPEAASEAPAPGDPVFDPSVFGAPTYDPAAFAAVPYGAPLPWDGDEPRRTRRPRSPLGALTVSAATLLAGVLLALRLSGVESLTAPRIVAAALLVVGGGLLLGAWVGRARWLIAVGLVLALALGATAAAGRAGLEDGVGQVTWSPTGDATYRLGAGEGVLDLTGLRAARPSPGDAAAGPTRIDARVGVGSLTVLVPTDVTVRVDGQVGVGELSVLDPEGSLTGDTSSEEGRDVREVFELPGDPAGSPQVELDLEVGMGEIEVRRGAA